MAEHDDTLLLTIPVRIDKDGKLNYEIEKIKELQKKGYTNVRIEIYGSPKNAAKLKGFNEDTFNKIKELQSVPENVIFDFLNTKGSISNKDFRGKALGGS